MISSELNKIEDYYLPIENLEESKFNRIVYPNYWIGEMGMKTGGVFSEKDEFIVNRPIQEKKLRYINKSKNMDLMGDFSILLDDELFNNYDIKNSNSLYYYYLYSNDPLIEIYNEEVSFGNVLYLKDSFSNVVLPYLALDINHISAWDMRYDNKIFNYLNNHLDIDTIIISYNIGMVPTKAMNDFQ